MAKKDITTNTFEITNNELEKGMLEQVTTHDQLSIDQVRSHIYSVRGVEVMLDRELAQLYGVETKVLNQAVKRNIQRFPERFMFQLSQEEWDSLRSQIVTSNGSDLLKSHIVTSIKGRGGDRYLPYVFTEQGVTQLSTVLRSKTAIEVSIRIMDAFVAIRRFLSANAGMFQRIEKVEQHQILVDQKMEQVLKRMDELAPRVTPEQIFATGCVWDAWSYVSELIRSAKSRIVLIDNFVDDRVLVLLTKRAKAVSATIHSRYTEQFKLDLSKHNEQYEPIEFIQLPHKSHDRFLIIDEDVYLMGASVKDMGMSLCAITKMEIDPDTIISLLK